MSRFSLCTYPRRQKTGREWNILSVFIHPYPFSDDQLDDALAPLLIQGGPFDEVHFCGLPESLTAISALYQAGNESAVFRRLEKIGVKLSSQVILFGLDQAGQISCNTLAGQQLNAIELLHEERQQSLQSIFIQRNGMMTANTGVHYTKPSGSHTTQFLRAANILEDSPAALQIAFWLFPYLGKRNVKRIVVDTSGIDSVGFAFAYERLRRGLQPDLPIVESHSSYGGLEKLAVPEPDTTLFIISASTSGGLRGELIKRGARADNIVTLFYLGKRVDQADLVLTNLLYDAQSNPNGLPKIQSYEEADCPYCKRHSYAIPIIGDQFSTEPARIDLIEVLLSDFPDAHRKILDQLAGTGLFQVFRAIDGRNFELFLDIEKMWSGEHATCAEAHQAIASLKARWQRLVKRSMPVHLERIIFTNYPGTRQLGGHAYELLPSAMAPNVRVMNSIDLSSVAESRDSASLVISACLDETHELMGISRDLRTVQPDGNTTYIAPIFRSSSKYERNRIESNLTFGEHGPKTFNLYSTAQIELPNCEGEHSWHLEYKRLEELVHWADLADIEVPNEIEQRVQLLREAPATGLNEALFWPTPHGQHLTLASDFTMVPNRGGQRYLTQADVFAIATSLFHQYRHGVKDKPRLMYKPYERTMISPESFQRFSDGILQAAFLRAARGSEIAYGNAEEQVSERMYAFLCHEVNDATRGRGPALMEYVVSLMIGRLTLYPDHQSQFLQLVANTERLPDWIRICAKFTQEE